MLKRYSIFQFVCFLSFSFSAVAQSSLFEYSGQVSERSWSVIEFLKGTAKSPIQSLRFNENALKEDQLVISLDGKQVIYNLVEKDERSYTDYTWYGRSDDQGSAYFTYMNGELAGRIDYMGKLYSVTPDGQDQVFFFEQDQSQYSKTLLDFLITREASENRICKARILIGYTPAGALEVATTGYSSFRHFAQVLTDQANQIDMNGFVILRSELAGVIFISDLPGSNNGNMDEIQAYQKAFSADICILISNHEGYSETVYRPESFNITSVDMKHLVVSTTESISGNEYGNVLSTNSIILKPGFVADLTSVFVAATGNCSMHYYENVITEILLSGRREIINYFYPNPVHDFAEISFSSYNDQLVQVQIVNLLGNIVQKIEYPVLVPGDQKVRINTASLEKGMYVYQVISGEDSFSGSFIRQ